MFPVESRSGAGQNLNSRTINTYRHFGFFIRCMSFTRAVHCYNSEYSMRRLFARFVRNLPRENKSASATHDDLNPRRRRRRRSVGLPVRSAQARDGVYDNFRFFFFFCPLAGTICWLVRRVFSSSPTRFPHAQTAVRPTNRYINFNVQIIKTHRRRQPRRRSPTSDYTRPVAVQRTCNWCLFNNFRLV